MLHVLEQLGIWITTACVLAGCVRISPAVATATPTLELPTLNAAVAAWPTQASSPLSTTPGTNSAQSGTDAATFVKETYPDDSVVTPGAKFDKTWDMKSIGTNTWNADYGRVLD